MTATLRHRSDPQGERLKALFDAVKYIDLPEMAAKRLGFFPSVEYLCTVAATYHYSPCGEMAAQRLGFFPSVVYLFTATVTFRYRQSDSRSSAKQEHSNRCNTAPTRQVEYLESLPTLGVLLPQPGGGVGGGSTEGRQTRNPGLALDSKTSKFSHLFHKL